MTAPAGPHPSFDVVVPTIGRPSLCALVDALVAARGPRPGRVLLVDDRDGDARRREPLLAREPAPYLAGTLEVLRGAGRGPAAARNVGWRTARAEWVAFLDDDVVPDDDWFERLAEDLAACDAGVAATQGRLRVPLPADRPPTDWERNVARLEGARWATADMAYRRVVLAEVDGFDERFPRAFREDADLALRVVRRGYRIALGARTATHPVRPADRWVSVRLQAGNRDDVLMRSLHGRGWRAAAGAPAGRLRRHVATTAAGLVGAGGLASGRKPLAAAGLAGWLVGTVELAWARIAPGPRTPGEVTTMAVTSVVLPAAACYHRAVGLLRLPGLRRRPGGSGRGAGALESKKPAPPAAVLLDRDGTLVADVPYNGDPERVVPVPGAREALDRLRGAGVPLAVVSNQSGVARGLVTLEQVERVNRRVEELLGPLGPWLVCVHRTEDGCTCRKPAPGLVRRAAEMLGVEPSRCAVIGDIGADVEAARAAGARGVLVPTPVTRPEEVAAAPEVATDLGKAVDLLIGSDR